MESTSFDKVVTPTGRALFNQLSAERWNQVVREAFERVAALEAVDAEREASGLSYRKCLKVVAPDVPWSRFQSWRKRAQSRTGPMWERLMDRRIPPQPECIPDSVRQAVIALRLAVPAMDCETARDRLLKQFGDQGAISDTSLRRIWSGAGLTQVPSDTPRLSRGIRYDGGAGLAFILAAEAETSAVFEMAKAALHAGRESVANQGEKVIAVEPEGGRDERGRLTADYNFGIRAAVSPGDPDMRHGTDESKRQTRDLRRVATAQNRPATLAAKLLSIGVYGLLTERRGFEGLDGPRGGLLGLLNSVPYMPRTCSKCLAELAILNVGDAMWGAHARKWNQLSKLWSDDDKPWLQMATYVDTTTDPNWTRKFALASKVSRVGRVMPCLSRIYVHIGPGVPLAVDTFVGTVSLKKQLVPTLQRIEKVVGEGELGRLTIVDAESATFETLSALASMKDRLFITVWKGPGVNRAAFTPEPGWRKYRKRDKIREGTVVLRHKSDSGETLELKLRAVEMKRTPSRHPHTTIFLTNDVAKELSTKQIADAYLSRWPHQEGRFRNGRNGMGTDRAHGYGGENVQHIALDTALEKSQRRQESAAARVEAARNTAAQLVAAKPASKGMPHQANVNEALKAVRKEVKTAEKALDKATRAHEKNLSTSRTIYKRDTTRDNIATVPVMAVIMLIEFALKKYFDGLKMEYRTFIEHFMNTPTTMTVTRNTILYQIELSSRNPKRSDQLRRACAEVTRRKLCRDGRLLVFEAVDPPGQSRRIAAG